MNFHCTSSFKATIQEFTKKRKRKLHSCKTDIPELFNKGQPEKNIHDWASPIFSKGQFTLFKVRVRNSAKGFGKSYGFRLHFALRENTQDIIFFGLLAKTEQSIFTDDEYIDLVETMINEANSGELIQVDLESGEIIFQE